MKNFIERTAPKFIFTIIVAAAAFLFKEYLGFEDAVLILLSIIIADQ